MPASPVIRTAAPVSAATTSAISATVTLFASVPTLIFSPRTSSAGAVRAAANTSAMSAACTSGRHGVPSESTST